MKKILTNWRHIPGVHCGSVAVRDVLHYYNFNMSEELCFGLGGGLGFYYSKNSLTPTRSIHVRGPWMEPGFFNHFGIEYTDWQYEDDVEKAQRLLIESINKNIPVLIQTDIYYLDYYNSGTHFPGHIVVVCGYDDAKEIFYLSDTAFEDLREVSFEQMKAARNSKHQPYPLSNNYLNIDLVNKKVDLKTAALNAVVMNAGYMINGTETLRGQSGVDVLEQWAGELPEWKKLDDWKWCTRFAYQVISKRGVDGAGFRWMYRDFLAEANEYLPVIKKMNLISLMDEIGTKWKDLSILLKKTSEADFITDEFNKASQSVNEIFILEKYFYSKSIELSEHK